MLIRIASRGGRVASVALAAASAATAIAATASPKMTNHTPAVRRSLHNINDDDNDDADSSKRIVVGGDQPDVRPSAVVVGGGACGVATAYALQRRGYAVTVLESGADVATACSRAPAGGMQRSNPTLDRAAYATTAVSLAQATADRVLPWRWRSTPDDIDVDEKHNAQPPFRDARMTWSKTLTDPHFLRWLCQFTWTSLWHNGDVPVSTSSSSSTQSQQQQQQQRDWSAADHTLAYTDWAIDALARMMHSTTLPSSSSSSSASSPTLAHISGLRDTNDDSSSSSNNNEDGRRGIMGAVKLVYDAAQWRRYVDAGVDDERTWAAAAAAAAATTVSTETAVTDVNAEITSPALQRAAQWQASVSSEVPGSEAAAEAVPPPTRARWGRFDHEPCVTLSPAETTVLEPWLAANNSNSSSSSSSSSSNSSNGDGDGADGMAYGAVYQPLARSAHCSAFTRALRRVCESRGASDDDGDVVPVRFVSDIKVTGFATAPVGANAAATATATATATAAAAAAADADSATQRVSAIHVTRAAAASTSSSSTVSLPDDCVVVVAAGSWTPLLLRRLGLYCPVYPLKGYSLLYDVTVTGDHSGPQGVAPSAAAPHWSLWWPRRMVADGMTYLSSYVVDDSDDVDHSSHGDNKKQQQQRQQHHQVRLASIGEFSGWDADGVAPDVRRDMLGQARRLLPHVYAAAGTDVSSSNSNSNSNGSDSDAETVSVSPPRFVAGLRPYVADGRPLIGRVTAAVTGDVAGNSGSSAPTQAVCSNLYVNTGPGFNGWKTCVGAGEVVARAIVDDAAATTSPQEQQPPLPFDTRAISPHGRIVAAPLFTRLCDALSGV